MVFEKKIAGKYDVLQCLGFTIVMPARKRLSGNQRHGRGLRPSGAVINLILRAPDPRRGWYAAGNATWTCRCFLLQQCISAAFKHITIKVKCFKTAYFTALALSLLRLRGAEKQERRANSACELRLGLRIILLQICEHQSFRMKFAKRIFHAWNRKTNYIL